MSVIPNLASSLGINSAQPDIELAEQIVKKNDTSAVAELVEHLSHKNKRLQSDCVKTLYEIGERKPELIADYYKEFADLLTSKNNRLVWGGMCALDGISRVNPKAVYGLLDKIIAAADQGSVITKDHAVNILATLAANKHYKDTCSPLLKDILLSAPTNQFPSYCEKALAVIDEDNKKEFAKIMTSRVESLATTSQKKRVEKVLKKLEKV